MIQTIPLSLETIEATGYQNYGNYKFERGDGLLVEVYKKSIKRPLVKMYWADVCYGGIIKLIKRYIINFISRL